jgi:orotidine-5'-phosphate decarboxylase
MDSLIDRIDAAGAPIVVGLDPVITMMPPALSDEMYDAYGRTPGAVSEMFLLYNKAVIDAVCDIVPAVKPQIAMYEMYGAEGVACYIRTCEYASSKGLYVIGDIKRGDIGSTAEAYSAHIGGTDIGGRREYLWHEDAVTVNPYFGTDGIGPFSRVAGESGKALFVLVKTSNQTSAELQDIEIASRGFAMDSRVQIAGASGRDGAIPLYEHVGELVSRWGVWLVGERGYSAVGAVVGATHPEVGRRLRKLMPHTFFLVPGYGAQGGSAEDIGGFFDEEGGGAIVNSSRGIIAAWMRGAVWRGKDAGSGPARQEGVADAAGALKAVAAAARNAAIAMRKDISRIFE